MKSCVKVSKQSFTNFLRLNVWTKFYNFIYMDTTLLLTGVSYQAKYMATNSGEVSLILFAFIMG